MMNVNENCFAPLSWAIWTASQKEWTFSGVITMEQVNSIGNEARLRIAWCCFSVPSYPVISHHSFRFLPFIDTSTYPRPLSISIRHNSMLLSKTPFVATAVVMGWRLVLIYCKISGRCGYVSGSPPVKNIYLTFASQQKLTILLRSSYSIRLSATYPALFT